MFFDYSPSNLRSQAAVAPAGPHTVSVYSDSLLLGTDRPDHIELCPSCPADTNEQYLRSDLNCNKHEKAVARWKIWKRPLRVATLCILSLSPVAFAEEPSPDETVEYINAKLAGCPFGPGHIMEAPQRISLESGYLRISAENWGFRIIEETEDSVTYDQAMGRRYTISVRVGDLSTNVRSVDYTRQYERKIMRFRGEVSIFCAKPDCSTIVNYPQMPGFGTRVYIGGATESGKVRFFLCDPDAVEKVRKAFTHLIRVSGGADELF